MRDIAFDTEKAAVLLDMMAHPARLRVLELISEREYDVNSLSLAVNMSQSALSQHLRKLRDTGFVATRRDRQSIFYSCRVLGVLKMLKTLESIYSETLKKTA